MLIRCPTCASGYDLPPQLLSPGRILRCAHCRDAWTHHEPTPSAPFLGPVIAAETRSARHAPPAAAPRPQPRTRHHPTAPRIGGTAIATLLVIAAAAAGMGAVGQRDRIVAAFRPSAALFATLGLPVNLRGLALADIHSTLGTADGAATLTLDGTITNLRPQSTAVPAIRIAVRDATDRELYTWTAPAPKARLAVGESIPFHSRLSAPPHEGETLSVSFADASPTIPRHIAEASLAGR